MKGEFILELDNMKKYKLKTLKDMDFSQEIKRKISNSAKEWIKWEKRHLKDFHSEGSKSFHNGSISMLQTFFNIKGAKRKCKNKK